MLTLEHPEVAPGVPPVCALPDRQGHQEVRGQGAAAPSRRSPTRPTIKYFMKDGREYVRELPGSEGAALLRRRSVLRDQDRAAPHARRLRAADRHDLRRPHLRRREERLSSDLLDRAVEGQALHGLALPGHRRARGQGHATSAMTTFKDGTVRRQRRQAVEGTTLLLGEDARPWR